MRPRYLEVCHVWASCMKLRKRWSASAWGNSCGTKDTGTWLLIYNNYGFYDDVLWIMFIIFFVYSSIKHKILWVFKLSMHFVNEIENKYRMEPTHFWRSAILGSPTSPVPLATLCASTNHLQLFRPWISDLGFFRPVRPQRSLTFFPAITNDQSLKFITTYHFSKTAADWWYLSPDVWPSWRLPALWDSPTLRKPWRLETWALDMWSSVPSAGMETNRKNTIENFAKKQSSKSSWIWRHKSFRFFLEVCIYLIYLCQAIILLGDLKVCIKNCQMTQLTFVPRARGHSCELVSPQDKNQPKQEKR